MQRQAVVATQQTNHVIWLRDFQRLLVGCALRLQWPAATGRHLCKALEAKLGPRYCLQRLQFAKSGQPTERNLSEGFLFNEIHGRFGPTPLHNYSDYFLPQQSQIRGAKLCSFPQMERSSYSDLPIISYLGAIGYSLAPSVAFNQTVLKLGRGFKTVNVSINCCP